ncbi:MAG: hypothetical protein HC896_07740 [Bacteroidales bacterium]|nr:hypothetical protein [Bacteroidales bacterium]
MFKLPGTHDACLPGIAKGLAENLPVQLCKVIYATKPNQAMKNLLNLFHSLKTSEVNWIAHMLSFKAGPAKQNKKLQLFNLLQHNSPLSDQKACELIYHKKPDSAFSHLKKRLQDDIISYASLYQANKATKANPEARCQELLVKTKWSLDRGLYDHAAELIDATTAIARQYELIPILINLYEIVRVHKLQPAFNVIDYLNEYVKIISNRPEDVPKTIERKATREHNGNLAHTQKHGTIPR